MADSLLSLQKISHFYGKEERTQVLFDVNLEISPGEYLAIIGRSGSGKTTLLNIIGTLDRPSEGKIFFRGENLFDRNDDGLALFRNQSLGFIFQFHFLLPEFTALENVLLPYRMAHKKVPPAVEARAKELIDRVGVASRMYNKSTNLSGGQQQRIAIARSMINNPAVILADEPTGNLDSESSEDVNKLMREINADSGTTFIIVTHDRHIAAKCDRVVEMLDGKVDRDLKTAAHSDEENWQELGPDYCPRCQARENQARAAKELGAL
jgi:lipoprotein-releasing system ATP-binding protein